MSFIQTLTEFFESIFKASSPEVKKRQEMRKIEGELKALPSGIYKNECLTPNFAEIFRILHENSKPLDDILSATLNSGNVKHDSLFEQQLILTGFSDDAQRKLETLTYEARKQEAEEGDNLTTTFEHQRHVFDSVMKQVSTPEFSKIDDTLAKLKQLADICKFSYISVIRLFDAGFDGVSNTQLSFAHEVKPAAVGDYLQDLYYLTSNLSLNSSVVRALLALHQLKKGSEPTPLETASITTNIRKINSIFTSVLTPEVIKKIVCLAKKDPNMTLKVASYTANSVKRYLEYSVGKFNSDETRIKTEIRDYTISFELKDLFGEMPMLELNTYNETTNKALRDCSPFAFSWITPMQTIKTFLNVYYSEQVRNVLNNIVIEGFFNSPSYKSDFSTAFYACNEVPGRLVEFEESFGRGMKNDSANIFGLIEDAKRDSAFLNHLGNCIRGIDDQAHAFIQNEAKNIFSLYKQIEELIIDSKKSKPALISNIKVLLSSTRNRDGSGAIEQQHKSWKTFLKVMKNYAIIGELEDDD